MKKFCILFIVLVFMSINVSPGVLSGSALFHALEREVRDGTKDDDSIHNEQYILSTYRSVEGVFSCAPSGMQGIEMKQAVLGYMQRHPEQRGKSGDVAIVNALIETWPCKMNK